MQLKIDNDVINHLLFHKALIDEESDASRINQYIEMVAKTSDGDHISMDNPFDRSIAIVFDLVMQQQLDPWDIDLVNFSTMYLKRAKEEKIDLITAGRIIYLAWKVLRLQSDNLVSSMETKKEQVEHPFEMDWADIPTGAWYDNADGYSYTNLVMKMPKPPIEEPLRRTSKRKVSLIELLSAFDDARKDAEEYQLLSKMRLEERERIAALARKNMIGTAHEDHIEEDVNAVWNKICDFPKNMMTFTDICKVNDVEERIKTLLSILFLAYDKKIKVSQHKFPYGKIYIKNIGL